MSPRNPSEIVAIQSLPTGLGAVPSPPRWRRLSHWTGQLVLLGMIVAGTEVLVSPAFTDFGTSASKPIVADAEVQLVEGLAFTPDGKCIASCGWDNAVRVWDVRQTPGGPGSELAVLTHNATPHALAFSPNGALLVVAEQDSLTVWSNKSGRYTPLLRRDTETPRCLAFSADGQTLATGHDDGAVRLWDMPAVKERVNWGAHAGLVRSVAFSPDGRRLVSSGQDCEVMLWDAVAGVPIRPLQEASSNPVHFVAYAPDGRKVAVGEATSARSEARLIDPDTGAIVARLPSSAGVCALAFSPDGSALATASVDRTIRLWDVAKGTELTTLTRGVGNVKALAFSPHGDRLAFAGDANTIELWDDTRQSGSASANETLTYKPDGHFDQTESSSLPFSTSGFDVPCPKVRRARAESSL
jgi:WD40 repeat protein